MQGNQKALAHLTARLQPQLFADVVIANMARLPSRAEAGVGEDGRSGSGLASMVQVRLSPQVSHLVW